MDDRTNQLSVFTVDLSGVHREALDSELENNPTVVVEHHEQPVATVYFVIKAGSTLDPEGKWSLASYAASLLNKGTKTRNSDELAEWIESYGGDFGAGSGNDFTFVNVSILSKASS